jgi:hypothetical protein
MSNDTEIVKSIQEAYMKRQHEEELLGMNTTLDKKLMEDITGRYSSFLGTFLPIGMFEKLSPGWYQDNKGGLFHYDGVVWDTVPDAKYQELEYLGA